MQLKDVYRDMGFDDSHSLLYTQGRWGRLLEIVFFISEDSLGVLAQTWSLSVICDLVMPAQYVPCIPVWMQTYLQNGGMTKLGPLLFLDAFHQAEGTCVSLNQQHAPCCLEMNSDLQAESSLLSA